LAARSSVDLPEPDNPISTEISPRATRSDAPATPTITPNLAWISARVSPASSAARASRMDLRPWRPDCRANRMSTS
jgi:hypothetical protein